MKTTHQHYLHVRGEYQLKLVVKLLGAGQLILLRRAQERLNVVQGNVNTFSRLALVYSLGCQEVDSRFTPLADLLKRNRVFCAVSLTTAQPPQPSGGPAPLGSARIPGQWEIMVDQQQVERSNHCKYSCEVDKPKLISHPSAFQRSHSISKVSA